MRTRKILVVASLSFVLAGAAALAVDFYMFLRRPVLGADQSRIYEVKPGASLRQIARDLEERNLLEHDLYWLILARLQGKARSVKAGEYQLSGPLTSIGLLDRLVTGKTRQFSLTLVEGWTFRQVMGAVARHPAIKHTISDKADVMGLLGKPGAHPEGWFFPDTYHFPRGTTDLEFLRRSHESMKQRLSQAWKARDAGLPLKTAYDALILASIVEKETALSQERTLIAAVLLSRLKQGMRLQTDPTVVYGLGDRYDGDIRARDLQFDTPYNTYTRKGLPPTPIAMPGQAALNAVMHPADTDALFFVAKKDGGHHFSATYAEHRKAVIKNQLSGRADHYSPRVE
jgi:UPF0755 protein